MPIPLTELRKELLKMLEQGGQPRIIPAGASIKLSNSWQELAKAVLDIGAACGVDIKIGLNLTTDVMCAKVAGTAVYVTRRELEDREFQKLYQAIGQAAQGAAAQQQQLAALQRNLTDNPYIAAMQYLPLARVKSEGEPVYIDAPSEEPPYYEEVVDPQSSFVVSTPPIDLSTPATDVAALDTPSAPDLILE